MLVKKTKGDMRAAVIIVPEIFRSFTLSSLAPAVAYRAYIDHFRTGQKADAHGVAIARWTSTTRENTLYRRD